MQGASLLLLMQVVCRARQAFEDGMTEELLHEYTKIDPWFLAQLGQLHQTETWLKTQSLERLSAEDLLQVKRRGFSDPQIAKAVGAPRPRHTCAGAGCRLHASNRLRCFRCCNGLQRVCASRQSFMATMEVDTRKGARPKGEAGCCGGDGVAAWCRHDSAIEALSARQCNKCRA